MRFWDWRSAHAAKPRRVVTRPSAQVLDALESHMRAAKIEHVRIDGQVEAATRQGQCDRFQREPRIRVALLVTGDEIRTAGATRSAAQIWDTNTPMLCAELARPSVELVAVEHSADCRDGLKLQLARMAGVADLVVTSGGLSVGEEDHVRAALGELEADIRFAGVAIKPGKPVAFGRLGSALWLGLPGNPLAAFVTWQLFGMAVLRRLCGQSVSGPRRRHVVTAHGIRRKAGRCEIRPVTIVGFDAVGREVVTFQNATHSARVGGLPTAHGLMFLPAETDVLPEGALVEFQPFACV